VEIGPERAGLREGRPLEKCLVGPGPLGEIGEEIAERGGAPRALQPIRFRDNDHRFLTIAGDSLRLAGEGTLDDFREFGAGFVERIGAHGSSDSPRMYIISRLLYNIKRGSLAVSGRPSCGSIRRFSSFLAWRGPGERHERPDRREGQGDRRHLLHSGAPRPRVPLSNSPNSPRENPSEGLRRAFFASLSGRGGAESGSGTLDPTRCAPAVAMEIDASEGRRTPFFPAPADSPAASARKIHARRARISLRKARFGAEAGEKTRTYTELMPNPPAATAPSEVCPISRHYRTRERPDRRGGSSLQASQKRRLQLSSPHDPIRRSRAREPFRRRKSRGTGRRSRACRGPRSHPRRFGEGAATPRLQGHGRGSAREGGRCFAASVSNLGERGQRFRRAELDGMAERGEEFCESKRRGEDRQRFRRTKFDRMAIRGAECRVAALREETAPRRGR
jgi:hypothetical protein